MTLKFNLCVQSHRTCIFQRIWFSCYVKSVLAPLFTELGEEVKM